jgi:hypothetical protein
VDWYEEKPENCYGDGYHPEHDGDGCLWSTYIRSPASHFGGRGTDRDFYRCIDADIGTDSDCNTYSHAYRDTVAYCYCYFYCYTDAASDVNPYEHAHRYFNRHTGTDSDTGPTYGHADASVSVPTRWSGASGHVASLPWLPQGRGLYRRYGARRGG